jgi:hypothetical protein
MLPVLSERLAARVRRWERISEPRCTAAHTSTDVFDAI